MKIRSSAFRRLVELMSWKVTSMSPCPATESGIARTLNSRASQRPSRRMLMSHSLVAAFPVSRAIVTASIMPQRPQARAVPQPSGPSARWTHSMASPTRTPWWSATPSRTSASIRIGLAATI